MLKFSLFFTIFTNIVNVILDSNEIGYRIKTANKIKHKKLYFTKKTYQNININ